MDVFTRFKHLSLSSSECVSSPEQLVQLSIKIKADYVVLLDRFAEQLRISRTELVNQLIKGALPDALRAFYDGQPHNPLDHMSFSDFMDKAISGEYLHEELSK